jgi:hypothetical protein
MTAYVKQFVKPTGGTYSAFPFESMNGSAVSLNLWSTYRAAAVEASAPNLGLYTVTIDDAFPIWAILSQGVTQPANWHSVDTGLRMQVLTDLTIVTQTWSPVLSNGSLLPIVIGDDYLASNGRAFEWTIDSIVGLTAAGSTCSFGGRYGNSTWLETGTVTDNLDGTWKLSVDLPTAATSLLNVGYHEWSVEVTGDAGERITRVRYGQRVPVVERMT